MFNQSHAGGTLSRYFASGSQLIPLQLLGSARFHPCDARPLPGIWAVPQSTNPPKGIRVNENKT